MRHTGITFGSPVSTFDAVKKYIPENVYLCRVAGVSIVVHFSIMMQTGVMLCYGGYRAYLPRSESAFSYHVGDSQGVAACPTQRFVVKSTVS